MKKLAKRFAIGAMAAMMALSAFSAQAAVTGLSGSAPLSAVQSQDLSDSIAYHSYGFDYENYGNYQMITDSPVVVNGFSGNAYFELSDLPIGLSYNSLRDSNVGFGPNFASDNHSRVEKEADGSITYYDPTGAITHFTFNAERNEMVDERNWSIYESDVFSMSGYMNTKPSFAFDSTGRVTAQGYREQSGRFVTSRTVQYQENGLIEQANYLSYGRTVTYEYAPCAEGEVPVIQAVIANGVKYTMVYNAQGNLLRVENAEGDVYLDMDYDATGKLVTRIGSTRIKYDDMGRAVNVKTYSNSGTLKDSTSFEYGNGATVVTNNGTSEIMNFNPDGSRKY